MKCVPSRFSHGLRETSAAVALGWLVLTLPSAVAQDAAADPAGDATVEANVDQDAADAADLDGPIVQIAPDRGGSTAAEADADAAHSEAADRMPAFWIGLQGRTVQDPVVKTQLQLADDLGVVIENVVPDSPAEKAGLRQHDIVIGVNGEPLQDMVGLREAVISAKGEPIELKIIRLAKEMKLSVTPAETPDDLKLPQPNQGIDGLNGDVNELMQRLMRQNRFGAMPQLPAMPGGNAQSGAVAMALPNGVSISVQSENGKPAKATVRRGDDQWQVDPADPKSLEQLPADLRPSVGRMLKGIHVGQLPRGGFDFNNELQEIFPEGQRDQFDAELGRQLRSPAEHQMLERMQALERQLQAMQRRFEEEETKQQ